MTTTEFQDALRRCADGDQNALRLIYDAESPRMLGVAIRMLRRRTLAEEAVQDAFVLAWRYAKSFDVERGNGRSWLYAILRNRMRDILRAENRYVAKQEPVDDELADESDDPEMILSKMSDASALKLCLEKLEPIRRQSIVLAYTNGLSHAEIAERLNVPLGTVKSWVRRSLLVLKECLA